MSEQPDQELAALGKTIRETREARAMTPAELAVAANIDREDLEALEAGRLAPADDLLPALGAALGTDTAALGGYLDTAAVLAAFGRRLRELRTKSNLTQDALGRRLTGRSRSSFAPGGHPVRRDRKTDRKALSAVPLRPRVLRESTKPHEH
jgi:transcriptional regulator with XRE-family HTH domain